MSDSRQIEREAEQTRHELERSLSELRMRMSPGQLVDQALDYARESGGAEFVRNLGRQATENPFSVCLIGAGIAWLMFGKGSHVGQFERGAGYRAGDALKNSRESATEVVRDSTARMTDWAAETQGQVRDFQEEAGSMAQSAIDRAAEAGRAAGEQVREGARTVADQFGNAASTLSDSASTAYEAGRKHAGAAAQTLSDAASTAASMGRSTAEMSASFVRRCAEEPLVLAGVGVAIGAAVGAALPITETENRLIGDTSTRLKGEVARLAQEQYEKGKAGIKEAVGEAVEQAGDRVNSPSGNGRDPYLDKVAENRETSEGSARGEQPSG